MSTVIIKSVCFKNLAEVRIFMCYVPPIMTFIQKISAYTLGLLTDKDLPDIALTGLEDGYDSESLRILAGYNQTDNAFQVFDTYRKSLVELGIVPASRKNLLINVVNYYAYQIIKNSIDPYSGFDEINHLIRKTEFDYPDIGLENCYAEYVSIWEVLTDGLQLHTGSGLTKEQYITETKEELVSHLKRWLKLTGGT